MDQLAQALAGIARVEKRIATYTRDDPLVARLLRQRGIGLTTGPGGSTTASVLRASVGRFDRFRNGKQLGRFCQRTRRVRVHATSPAGSARRRPA